MERATCDACKVLGHADDAAAHSDAAPALWRCSPATTALAHGVGECHIPTPVLETSDDVQSEGTVPARNAPHGVWATSHDSARQENGLAGPLGGPLENKGGGSLDTTPRGVGVLYRPGMVI